MLSVGPPEADLMLGTTMHWIPLQPLGKAVIAVTGRLEGQGRDSDGAALLVAEFEPMIANQHELSGSGLYLSPRFGPFAYLQTKDKIDGTFTIRFSPPGDRIPRRIGLRLFRCEQPLKVTDLRVVQVAPGTLGVATTSSEALSDGEFAGSEIHWLNLPDTIGNRIAVAGVLTSACNLEELPQVVADLDTIPTGSVLVMNGLRPPDGENSLPTAPLRVVNGECRATFSVPDGAVLARVGLLARRGVHDISQIAIDRAIFSQREGDVLVNISVDVEALPVRANSDHVNKLIYGRVGGGDGEYGIPLEMRVFRERRIPATFYLECGQCALWGSDTIADVGKFIMDGGFDLQLHLHSELVALAHAWKWLKSVPPMLHNLDRSETFRVMGFAVEHFHGMVGKLPTSFRAGSYLFGPHTLEALKEFGIDASSNYRADQRPKNAFDFDGPAPMRPFKWSNGILEFPITLSPEPLSALSPRECWRRILHHVQINQTWVVNVVLHSWSFMHRDKEGHQVWRNSELMDNLIEFIELAPVGVRFASISEIAEAAANGKMDIPLEKDIGTLVARKG